MRTRWWWCLWAASLSLGLVSSGWAANSARSVLGNKLTVLAVQDRTAPVAAFHLGVRFDPLAIPPEQAGVAALVGQALQQELQARLRDARWELVAEEVRGRAALGVNTESDYWEIRGQVTAGRLEATMQLVGEVVFGGQPPSESIIAEAQRVLQASLAERSEQVVEATYYRFLKAYYGRLSPLAEPLYGHPQSLANLQPEQVQAFARAYLKPSQTAVCLIGPAVPAEAIGLMRRVWGGYEGGQAAERPRLPRLPTESRVVVGQMPGWGAASTMIGVPVPDCGTRGFIAAQLLYTLLAGEQGRLEQTFQKQGLGINRLFERRSGQSGITVLAPMAVPRPFLAVHLVSLPRQMEAGRQMILGQLLELARQPVGAAEYQAAVDRLLNAYAQSQMNRLNFAKVVNCYELYEGDSQLALGFPAVVRSLTADEIQRLAQISCQHHAIGVMLPGDNDDNELLVE